MTLVLAEFSILVMSLDFEWWPPGESPQGPTPQEYPPDTPQEQPPTPREIPAPPNEVPPPVPEDGSENREQLMRPAGRADQHEGQS